MLEVTDLNVWYGQLHALKAVNISFPPNQITAIIGPSGCGKSTLLKSLNRLIELTDGVRVTGQVTLDGEPVYDPQTDPTEVRTRIGLLAQKPTPLPMSIFDNVAYGLRIHGIARGNVIKEHVKKALTDAHLWDEVKYRLTEPAYRLSVGQQQRLCLARALAIDPEVLLCDESTSALDPVSARAVEDLLLELRERYTIIMVTHNLGQAERLADYALFLWLGELAEHGSAERVFNQPESKLMQGYLAREFG